MAKKTFADLFPNSTLASTGVTFDDSFFETYGISLSATTDPQEILAAIAFYLTSQLTSENRTANSDETMSVTRDSPRLVTESSVTKVQDTFRFNFFRVSDFDSFTPTLY